MSMDLAGSVQKSRAFDLAGDAMTWRRFRGHNVTWQRVLAGELKRFGGRSPPPAHIAQNQDDYDDEEFCPVRPLPPRQ